MGAETIFDFLSDILCFFAHPKPPKIIIEIPKIAYFFISYLTEIDIAVWIYHCAQSARETIYLLSIVPQCIQD